VREYWQKQFEIIHGQLEPLEYETDENDRSIVTVHLVVRDLEGNLLLEKTVQHIFTIENDLINLFEIGDTEPVQKDDTKAENFQCAMKFGCKFQQSR